MIKITSVDTQGDNAVVNITYTDFSNAEHTASKSFPISQVLTKSPAEIRTFILDKVAIQRAALYSDALETKFAAFIGVDIEAGLP